ncbi:LLM class oxidoreductase [Granulosicoccus sp. 3-233]|uniref:LLM class oxidoreductase n=1 Tax=Granulosicoccus sp. 3-233 TaxID=3417969 RepID=UPI003D33D6C5
MNEHASLDAALRADVAPAAEFAPINAGYNGVFRPDRLSLGLVVPIESYPGSPVPTMVDHVERVQLAEDLGFSAVWLRDVPFNVPSFGDAGQLFDPFVYLGLLAGQTRWIALGVASLVLPLDHPARVAKAAASVDVLSGGRLILGVASGDRSEEYPAFNISHTARDMLFREGFDYIRQMAESTPVFSNHYGYVNSCMDMLPKPSGARLPLLVTGSSRQTPEWIAEHADGWMVYPRDTASQAQLVKGWRKRVAAAGRPAQPVMQPLYVDLVDDPAAPLQPIHLGYRTGVRALRAHLRSLEVAGVNHVALNLRFNQSEVTTSLKRLSDELMADFS